MRLSLRSCLSVLILLILSGCHGTLEITGLYPGDDDDVSGDDDDVTGDDDDSTGDDDDSTGDDDDSTGDDDDSTGDDDDSTAGDCFDNVITCDALVQSNNGLGSNQVENYSCVGAPLDGPELNFQFTAPSAGPVVIELWGHDQDLDLYLLDGATCAPQSCFDGSWQPGDTPESTTVTLLAGQEITIVVEGWDGAVSDFNLMVDCSPVVGDDDDDDTVGDDDDVVAIDADGDGYGADADCDDNDPAVNPGAVETCDTVDNDCDGQVDDGACQGCTQASSGGHTYQFCDDFGLDWWSAEQTCGAFGYYLVTVDDAVEDAFLAANTGGSGEWWLGYTDQGGGNEGSWYWSAGNGTGYTNWNPGEPNDSGNEDCAEMAAWTNWQWNDIQCWSSKSWICEGDF